MSNTTPEYDGGDIRPYFAIISAGGETFDQSLGAARQFRIYERTSDGCKLVELRDAPVADKGVIRWRNLAKLLHDCAALIGNVLGEAPILILANHQIRTYMLQGEVKQALDIIAGGGDLSPMKVPEPPRLGNASSGCCGGGGGRRRHGGCGGGEGHSGGHGNCGA